MSPGSTLSPVRPARSRGPLPSDPSAAGPDPFGPDPFGPDPFGPDPFGPDPSGLARTAPEWSGASVAPAVGPEPVPAPARRPGRHLRPVDPGRRRRSPAVPVIVGAGIVLAALLALAVMHAFLIAGQLRLDGMRRDTAAEQEEIRRLELQVAELEAPDRVLDAARERLGMVEPGEVGYLLPAGIDTGIDEAMRVEPAEPAVVAPDPAGDPAGRDTEVSRSPEERALDDALASEGQAEGQADPPAADASAAGPAGGSSDGGRDE